MPSTIRFPLTLVQTFFPAYLVYFLHRMDLIFRINHQDKMIALGINASLVFSLANFCPMIIGKGPVETVFTAKSSYPTPAVKVQAVTGLNWILPTMCQRSSIFRYRRVIRVEGIPSWIQHQSKRRLGFSF